MLASKGLQAMSQLNGLSQEATLRIRDQLHSVQVGLNLLRQEMLAGDLQGADMTYATIQRCLLRLANDESLATAVDAD